MTFKDKTALITGGASGMGLAMAQKLAAAGASVILTDVDRAELDRASVRGARTIPLDVTDRAQWAQVAKSVGDVDILINNAGIGPNGYALADMNPTDFDRVIAIDLVGVYNGIHTFAAGMRDRRSGHILNTASMAGIQVNIGLGAYTAAKFAVVAMTQTLRLEMEPYGVGVTAFCPGLVTTRLFTTTAASATEMIDWDLSVHGAIEADVAAEMAINGIIENKPVVVTHGEFRAAVEAHGATVVAAFDGVPVRMV